MHPTKLTKKILARELLVSGLYEVYDVLCLKVLEAIVMMVGRWEQARK